MIFVLRLFFQLAQRELVTLSPLCSGRRASIQLDQMPLNTKIILGRRVKRVIARLTAKSHSLWQLQKLR